MKVIRISTQIELDKLPDKFDEHTQIVIENTKERIYVTKARENSSVVAWENSSVVAWENSSVVAWGNSSVEARENSSVEARGNSSVVARENSSVEARENSSVVAWENSSVVAWENSSVEARENSSVEARGNSSVVAWENSSVEARENSSVEARENSSVEARENSSVEARENSSVTLFNESVVWVLSAYVIIKKLLDYSTAIIKRGDPKIEEQSSNATVKTVPKYEIIFEEWLRRGYVVADGISKKLISQKKLGEIEVFEVEEFPKKKSSYVVKRGDTYSHGETVEKAIEDLRYKIADRDTSKYDHWKSDKNKQITLEEAIQGYRTITGACEFGTKQFVGSITLPEIVTPKLILKLTKNQFGNEQLKEFLG